MKAAIIFLVLVCGIVPHAQAKIVEKRIEYRERDALLSGFLAYDDAKKGKRPGVLVVHEWTGEGPYVQKRARMLAELGYVAFAADIYGKGIRPKAPKEAGEMAGKFKADRGILRARAFAGLDVLKSQPNVDPNRLAAIGYCFGGTTVLELARAGADLKGVVSFHGGLSTPTPAGVGGVKAKVVVLTGSEDPTVKEEERKGFADEMRAAKADWTMTVYSNTVHSFTNPEMVGASAMPGVAEYNPESDRRSWASMQDYFREWF